MKYTYYNCGLVVLYFRTKRTDEEVAEFLAGVAEEGVGIGAEVQV
jgi:hypothetical protein